MSLNSKFIRVALAFCLVLSMSVLTFADTIRLKDGSIIKGKIVSFGEGKFTIVIGEGARQRQMMFFADEVESIEFEAVPVPSGNIKTSLPTYTDTSVKKDTVSKNTPTNQTDETKTTPTKSVIITDNTTQPNTNNSTTTNTPTQNNPNSTTTTNPNTTTKPKPLILNAKVLADNTNNGWTNSGWVVRKGQKIRINGKGQINLGNSRFSSPAGVNSLPDNDKLMKAKATGGLIAVIGDDNNEFIFIGETYEFVAARDGALFLGINEGNLDDNSGAFDVTIEITPN